MVIELLPSRLLKYTFYTVFLVGVGAIGYCGLHFLWKIAISIFWIFYLAHLKKQYTTAQFNINDLNYPRIISNWILVLYPFDTLIIIWKDQSSKEDWSTWVFQAKKASKS